jgi:2-polyprenyl-3-methyl-5-hydroxy-6-metoxy-1,4-benzoquinol methylase
MKRSLEKEMMDLPGNPPHVLAEDLRNLQTINRYLGAYRGPLRYLEQLVGKETSRGFSMIDVGTGGGDIPVAVVRWAKRKRIPVKVVGLDPDPVTAETARQQTRDFPEISIVRADAFRLPFSPSSFDFVFTSQVLHHFPEEEILTLLRHWSKSVRKGIMVSDLIRHPLAYHGIRLATRLLTNNPMTRNDAPLSVQRAFTLKEWQELFMRAEIGPFHLSLFFPFRVFAFFPSGR